MNSLEVSYKAVLRLPICVYAGELSNGKSTDIVSTPVFSFLISSANDGMCYMHSHISCFFTDILVKA